MFIGDIYFGFHNTMFFTYISLAAVTAIGIFTKKFGLKEILLAGVSSSVCFFLITNFGVWLVSGLYENNVEGLLQAYIMPIPFFHKTLASTLLNLFVLKILFDFSVKKKIA